MVTIDAFYNNGLSPTSKSKFPNATPWAYKLKNILSNDPRFDTDRFFYTGYSYGGDTVIGAISNKLPNQQQWRAIAPAEAGTKSEVVIIPQANHSFSTFGAGGIIQGGIASNGCTDNPVIRTSTGFIHTDGTPLTKSNPLDECVNNTRGGGGTPDKLDLAVSYIISFFNKYK